MRMLKYKGLDAVMNDRTGLVSVVTGNIKLIDSISNAQDRLRQS